MNDDYSLVLDREPPRNTVSAMSLADNLKRLRIQKQLSQPDLAEKAKLSKGYVYMLESGEMTNPSLEKLLQISETLECTIADLVGEAKTAAKSDAGLEIPAGLQEFAKKRKREGDPINDEEMRSLAHMQYRGKRPQSVDDWAYVYEFLKRTLGKGE
jgi:transcriptional regulator with XRE-family HTH domain